MQYNTISNMYIVTCNNLGVSAGTADETYTGFNGTRIVLFDTDPHTINTPQNPDLQSPGYLFPQGNYSSFGYNQFYGTVSGLNDRNVLTLNEYEYLPNNQKIQLPYLQGPGVLAGDGTGSLRACEKNPGYVKKH